MALVTVTNLTTGPLSTDVGLLNPGQVKTMQMGPDQAYRASEWFKTLVDAGRITCTILEETGKLDALEPASVGTASVADLAVTAAKLGALAVTTAKIDNLAVTAGKIGALAVTTAKIDDLGVTVGKIAAATITAAKLNKFMSTEQTGTGAAQNIAHGLTGTPSVVMWSLTDAPAGAFVLTEGVHDGTNVKMTVTTGLKFKVLALI